MELSTMSDQMRQPMICLKCLQLALFTGKLASENISNDLKYTVFRLFDDEKIPESPRKVFLAQLLPRRTNKSKSCTVQSILAPRLSFHYSPGAKRIDVISRIMFPATFASLNVIYWSYYLTKAGEDGEVYQEI